MARTRYLPVCLIFLALAAFLKHTHHRSAVERVAPARADDVKTVIAAAQNSPTAAFVRALPFHARLLLAALLAKAPTRSAGTWLEKRVARHGRSSQPRVAAARALLFEEVPPHRASMTMSDVLC